MKMLFRAALAVLLFTVAPAFAQWQTPTHSVPIGQGIGVTGFGSVVPGAAGLPLVSGGPSADPSYQPLTLTPLVKDLTNQTIACVGTSGALNTGYLVQHVATGPITYTLPRANTCFSGFGFWVYALSSGGVVTLTPNAADNFDTAASGVSVVLNSGTWAFIYTDAAASGAWHLTGSQAPAVVASDGTACQRPSSTPRVASCRTVTTSGYGHDFEAGSHITLSASAGEYGTYGDDTLISAPMGTTAPFYYNSFPTPTFNGPGRLDELGGYHWTPIITGPVTTVYGINLKDAAVSGGGSLTNQYGVFCPAFAAASNNRCLFIAGDSEIRGHLHATGISPTLSGCGTTPQINGNDQAGVIVTGTGTPTSCTLTFIAAFTAATPACLLNWASGALATMSWVTTSTTITITQTAQDNSRIVYHCWDVL